MGSPPSGGTILQAPELETDDDRRRPETDDSPGRSPLLGARMAAPMRNCVYQRRRRKALPKSPSGRDRASAAV